MTKVQPINFSPELVATMKLALESAVHRVERSHRTSATTAKLAAADRENGFRGHTDLHKLTSAAADEGRVPAA